MRSIPNHFIFFLLLTLVASLVPNFVLGSTGQSLDRIIKDKIHSLTLEQKVGQLFIVGFSQTDLNPQLEKFLTETKPGSFILFKRNITSIAQIKDLNRKLYRLSYNYSQLPPLIAVDQEGGAVSRLPIHPPLPHALSVGKTESTDLSFQVGKETGLFLREVGFNLNLAPVLDLTQDTHSFIGMRAFGSDPKTVSDLGEAYAKGLLESRVIPTGKHFPGTGAVKQDPHNQVVVNEASKKNIIEKQILPFKEFIAVPGEKAIMLSHLIYPSFDSKNAGTFSKPIVDFLRENLEFTGIVMTDDLQMKASRKMAAEENPALKALMAGADIVMLTWSSAEQKKAFQVVTQAVKDGKISEKDLNLKLHRILRAKAFANIYRRPQDLPSLSQGNFLSSESYVALEKQILVQNMRPYILPSQLPQKGSVSSSRRPASVNDICLVSASDKFNKSFKRAYKGSQKVMSFLPESFIENDRIESTLKSCDVIISVVNSRQQAHWLKLTPTKFKKKLVVINQSHPSFVSGRGYLKKMDLYFEHEDSGKKIAQHLDDILRDLNSKLASN